MRKWKIDSSSWFSVKRPKNSEIRAVRGISFSKVRWKCLQKYLGDFFARTTTMQVRKLFLKQKGHQKSFIWWHDFWRENSKSDTLF